MTIKLTPEGVKKFHAYSATRYGLKIVTPETVTPALNLLARGIVIRLATAAGVDLGIGSTLKKMAITGPLIPGGKRLVWLPYEPGEVVDGGRSLESQCAMITHECQHAYTFGRDDAPLLRYLTNQDYRQGIEVAGYTASLEIAHFVAGADLARRITAITRSLGAYMFDAEHKAAVKKALTANAEKIKAGHVLTIAGAVALTWLRRNGGLTC